MGDVLHSSSLTDQVPIVRGIDSFLQKKYINNYKTCPKGFGLKVAKLRLKTPLGRDESIPHKIGT